MVRRLLVPGDDDDWTTVRPRPATLVLHSVVLAALIGGIVAFVEADKSVVLSVDGETREVQTFAGDVAGVLDQEGVVVEAQDTVAPDPSTTLKEGQKIAVRNGRLVSVTVDGEQQQLWTTATTIDEALSALGYRGDGVYLSASRSKRIPLDGIEFELRMPKDVTVVADGVSRTMRSTAPTLAQVLAQNSIQVGPVDEVSVPLATRPTDDMVVTIVRVVLREELAERPVEFTSERREDPEVLVGTTKVVQEGANGTVVDVFSVQVRDGVEIGRTLVETRAGVAAVNEVVAVGTKPRPAATPTPTPTEPEAPADPNAPPPPETSASGLNWAALADCESSGNPQAYNPAGPYYGLYQFSASTWRSVGGSGVPTDHSAGEQTYRAQLLYERSGRSPWPYCGRFL